MTRQIIDYGPDNVQSAAPPGDFAKPVFMLVKPPEVTGGTPNVTVAPAAGAAASLDERGRLPRTIAAANVFAADPGDAVEGEYWIRSDLNEFRWREGGVTYKVAGVAV